MIKEQRYIDKLKYLYGKNLFRKFKDNTANYILILFLLPFLLSGIVVSFGFLLTYTLYKWVNVIISGLLHIVNLINNNIKNNIFSGIISFPVIFFISLCSVACELALNICYFFIFNFIYIFSLGGFKYNPFLTEIFENTFHPVTIQ